MHPSPAFLFDLNGTMIDDMQYHIKAWHGIINKLGVDISMEQMKAQCYGKNEEVLERIFPGRFSLEAKQRISFEKEGTYQKEYKPALALIDGLLPFLQKCEQHHIPLAIGSAAIMFNIDFVLDGLNIRSFFDAIVSADNVTVSKPDPETYFSCATLLNQSPSNCIVFEDSPKGVEAASNAGMRSVVLTTMHPKEDFIKFDDIICFVENYLDEQLIELLPW